MRLLAALVLQAAGAAVLWIVTHGLFFVLAALGALDGARLTAGCAAAGAVGGMAGGVLSGAGVALARGNPRAGCAIPIAVCAAWVLAGAAGSAVALGRIHLVAAMLALAAAALSAILALRGAPPPT